MCEKHGSWQTKCEGRRLRCCDSLAFTRRQGAVGLLRFPSDGVLPDHGARGA